ncbi:MAG: sulfatase-like hydrolase/transferase [Lentisphaeria bacterium]|nr:sulfatase-like hydrolase/transferase [Lentisphaeria bacterium]
MDCSRRSFLKQLSGAAAAAASVRALAAAPPSSRKPNIVYLMADELGYHELSCMGHPHIRTPVIDRVAAEGVRFTQALAGSSVCAPTRCCFLTGKHAGHTSVRSNGGGTPLRAGEETIASVLKRAGYATGGFGKWGCGGRGSTGVPEEHGFDVFVGYYDQVHAHSYYPAYILRNSREVPLAGNRGGRSGETYSHYVIWNEAMRFIRENRERPFLCYLPVTPPHGMFDIPDTDPAWDLYREQPWPEDARRYAAMVSMLDRQVGELLLLLRELDLEQNTILFFSGDNGGMDYFRDREHPRGFHAPNVDPRSGIEFRGQKGTLYEGGLRVPMLARWPGRIAPGRVSDLPFSFPDVLPTLAELAGAAPPADTDGISIVPELLGEEAAGRAQERHKAFYWELGGQTAVRLGTWKAVRPKPDAAWELYDLAKDVQERNNLAAGQAEILAAMTAFAAASHEPVVEGVFQNTADHEKDRRAKWGDTQPGPKVNSLSPKGLVPFGSIAVVRASSESAFNGKLARHAVDGDPNTIWHSAWQGQALPHPHELVLDLGRSYTVTGFRYLARQDDGWNGALKECEFFVGERPDGFGEPVIRAAFTKTRQSQEATCAPVRGRYVLLRALSEVNGGPWASVAEIGVIGE